MNRLLFILCFFWLSVSASAQTTDFTFRSEGDQFCAPAQIRFTQTSSGRPKGYLWDFGNGQRSNNPRPLVTYANAGTYTVRLITVYENTTAEKTRQVTITRSVSSSFTVDRERRCQPGEFRFTGRGSGNIVRNEWDFGDGSQVVSTTSLNMSHTYTEFGNYTVTLTSYNEQGCYSRSSQNIEISRPEISGTRTPESGCAPINAQFTASVSLPAGSASSNIQYNWDFGDGNIIRNSLLQMSHNYTAAGVYAPVLTITTQEGCTATFAFDSIKAGTPPTNHIAYTQDSVICASEKARFISHADGATEYEWVFGNGSPVITTDTFIDKKFNSLGVHQVTVTPKFRDCRGTPITLQVEVIGVIAEFSFRNTCTNRDVFDFRNLSQGHITSYLWNVGQQRTPVATYDMTRRFPRNGTYPVLLTVWDSVSGCVDSSLKKVYTADPRLVHPADAICIRSQTRFKVEGSYSNPAATYTWQVLGQQGPTNTETSLNLIADSLGIFNSNYVIINMGNAYCPDTVSLNHPIRVKGPRLSFDLPDNICQDTKLEVNNTSGPYFPGDSILSWSWNFGLPGMNDQAYQPQPVQYPEEKSYAVKLIAADINGCRDTLVKRVNVRPMPFLWTIPRKDTICQGQSSGFIAYTSDRLDWVSAEPVNGLCQSCDTLTLRPERNSLIRVSSTNTFQCRTTDSISIDVVMPFTASSIYTDTAICEKEKLVLGIEPSGLIVNWSPAELVSSPNSYNPVVSPPQTTNFHATITDSVGCFSGQADILVKVKSKPEVEIGPNRFLPYNSLFALQPRYSANTRSYTWSPADSLTCEHCPNPSGYALQSSQYKVKIVSDSGCVAEDIVMIYVECRNANILLPKAFTPNNDRLNDVYRPTTRGIQQIIRFAVYNRYGQMLYEARNFSPNKNTHGWDGNFKGSPQPAGAYVYVLDAICETGQNIQSNGSFILIR